MLLQNANRVNVVNKYLSIFPFMNKMSTYQDIDWSFDPHPGTHDIMKQTDVQAVKTWLKNLVLTSQGENVDDPYFGLGITQLQFELFNPILRQVVVRKIHDQVSRYLPEVVIESVDVFTDEIKNDIQIVIYFYVKGKYEPVKFTYTIERTR